MPPKKLENKLTGECGSSSFSYQQSTLVSFNHDSGLSKTVNKLLLLDYTLTVEVEHQDRLMLVIWKALENNLGCCFKGVDFGV